MENKEINNLILAYSYFQMIFSLENYGRQIELYKFYDTVTFTKLTNNRGMELTTYYNYLIPIKQDQLM